MTNKMAIAVGGWALAVVVLVFGLKVWHAQRVCSELGGRWADGECYFNEPSVTGTSRR